MHIGEKVVCLTNCAGKTEYAQENSAIGPSSCTVQSINSNDLKT